MRTVIKVAAGILLASLILFGLRLAFVSYTLSELQERMEESADRRRQQAAEQASFRREQVEAAKSVALDKQRRVRERKRESARISRIEVEAQKIKNAAWLEFYQEREDCNVFLSDRHMVECVQHKMDARKEFEQGYASQRAKGGLNEE